MRSRRTAAFRLLLLGGMGGFLVIALAIPDAYERDGLAFGLGYSWSCSCTRAMYVKGTSVSEVAAILRIVPFNLTAAGLVVLGVHWEAMRSGCSGPGPPS